jgi:hypothetical protein
MEKPMRNIKHIDNTLIKRKEIIEIALIAILVGFGIGAAASAFISYTEIPNISKYIISALTILIGFLLLVKGLIPALNFNETIEAIFVANQTNDIIPIHKYRFSRELSDIFKAIFQESKSLEKLWLERDGISTGNSPKEKPKPVDTEKDDQRKKVKPTYLAICAVEVDSAEREKQYKKHGDLLKEAVEFILLEQLSLHLSSYFKNKEDDKEIREYKTSDIPHFLLENRVFSILTKPIEERDIFLDAFPDPNNRPEGEIHQLWSSNGAMYKRFELLLPKETKISKIPSGFKLETNRIEISAEVIFENFNASIERSFILNYMNSDPSKSKAFKLNIKISGRVKPLSLLSNKGWTYYQWLDTFLEKIEKNFSFKDFLDTINWPQLSAAIHIENNQKRTAEKIKPIKPEKQPSEEDTPKA